MPVQDYQNFQDPEAKRREPLKAEQAHDYKAVYQLKGAQARSASIAMGIYDGPKQEGYLVEVRETNDHRALMAYSDEAIHVVRIYSDNSVIESYADDEQNRAVQTVYSPNGDIETLEAAWNADNGYQEPYKSVSLETGQHEICRQKVEQYEALSLQVENDITRQNNIERGR